MARVLLACWGSFGDLFPSIAVAGRLRAAGHEPVVATCPFYREIVEREGLAFRPAGPDVRPDDVTLIARIMDPRRGSEVLMREILMPGLDDSFADLEAAASDVDLVVSHPVTFAAPLVAARRRMPWLSSVLAPMSFFSPTDFPALPNLPAAVGLRRLGAWTGRVLGALSRRVTAPWMAPVAALRRRLGLPQGGHPLFEGQFSPLGTLALFSRVLGTPQPDWPPQTEVTGFPFFNTAIAMPPAVTAFLDGGPPPVVFTLGSSAVHAAGGFFEQSVAAARRLGVRALLLAGPSAAGAPPMPEGVLAVESAPHDRVFPRAAAIVHQGGVGTTGQALRSGRPQLVVPHAHDQFDNAVRVDRAGVGQVLSAARYRADRAASAIDALRADAAYAARAGAVADVVRAEGGADRAAEYIGAAITRG
ncbi:MAG: glycosyltransferase [Vicinamibacterales bacterium]